MPTNTIPMKHTNQSHKNIYTSSASITFFRIRPTQTIMNTIINSEDGKQLLQLLKGQDITKIHIGLLSWLATKSGVKALKEGKISSEDIFKKPAIDCLNTLKKFIDISNTSGFKSTDSFRTLTLS